MVIIYYMCITKLQLYIFFLFLSVWVSEESFCLTDVELFAVWIFYILRFLCSVLLLVLILLKMMFSPLHDVHVRF